MCFAQNKIVDRTNVGFDENLEFHHNANQEKNHLEITIRLKELQN